MHLEHTKRMFFLMQIIRFSLENEFCNGKNVHFRCRLNEK
jgi:hypothetical protein